MHDSAISEQNLELDLTAAQQSVDEVEFCSLEELQAASTADGWSIEYRQLKPGALRARLAEAGCGGITLLDERINRVSEVEGSTPEDHLTVLLPARPTPITLNGATLDRQSIGLSGPGRETHIRTGENVCVVSMHIPLTMLRGSAFGESELAERWPLLRSKGMAVDAARVRDLRELMFATIRQDIPAGWQQERASELVRHLDELVAAGRDPGSRMSGKFTWQVIARAREYIEAHLAEPIALDDLCAHCAASRSKVERAFKSQLQTTPIAYIRARRLDRIRDELLVARSSGRSITQIATDHGFHHPGHFSSVYRDHFGELPRETLICP